MKYWLALLLSFVAGNAYAQGLTTPGEVLIFVHKEMLNTEFVDPLVCALSKVLRVPVRTRSIDLPLTADLLDAPGQFSPRKLAGRLAQATAGDSEFAMPFRYFFLDRDLKSPSSSRYAFIESYHAPWNVGVLSVARLTPKGAELDRKQIADVTQLRVYKLVLKSIGRMSGLHGDGCVLKFSSNLEEVDSKSAEFCPQDRTALVAAKVLNEKPSESCTTVVAAQ
jgi:predicted Zn-dependent protease